MVFSSLAYPYFEVDIEQNRINKKLNKLNDFALLLYPMPVLWDNCRLAGGLQFDMGRLIQT